MPWFKTPAYQRGLSALVRELRGRRVWTHDQARLVFLCGGKDSERREDLRKYLTKRHPELRVFYAEAVWSLLTDRRETNLLHVESQLAALADAVLVLVESPGTFAELGAFASLEELRRKLIPILDCRHDKTESFLNVGPIRWVDKESSFRPSVSADFEAILLAASEIDERLSRIGRVGHGIRLEKAGTFPKLLVFLISDLAAIIGPAPEFHFRHLLGEIVGKFSSWSADQLLGLALALGLVDQIPPEDRSTRWIRSIAGTGRESHGMYLKREEIDRWRARFLPTLLQIDDWRVRALPGGHA